MIKYSNILSLKKNNEDKLYKCNICQLCKRGEIWMKYHINTNQTNILNPEIRIYEKPSTLTYEASIRTMLLKDYYITMSNIDRSEYYNIKFQKKPFMVWIWISVIFISMGGFIRLFKNAKNY